MKRYKQKLKDSRQTGAEYDRGTEEARRYAIGTNINIINVLRDALKFAEAHGALDDEAVTALKDWDEKHLGSLIIGTLVDREISVQSGIVDRSIDIPTDEILQRSYETGMAALELAGIVPIAFLNDVTANSSVH